MRVPIVPLSLLEVGIVSMCEIKKLIEIICKMQEKTKFYD